MVTYEMANGVIATVLMTYELPEPGINPADVTYIIGSKGMIDCDQYGKVRYTTGGEWKLYKEQPQFDFLKDYLDPNRLIGLLGAGAGLRPSDHRGPRPRRDRMGRPAGRRDGDRRRQIGAHRRIRASFPIQAYGDAR